ncbi:ankyrin repeat-containing domain protein [Morchella snyderi]|nr:ankyrin repeat-containing domain protein [Morchella snyderi]
MSNQNQVFRLRELPLDVNFTKIIATLQEKFPRCKVDRSGSKSAILPSPYSTTEKTALVQFFDTTQALDKLGSDPKRACAVIDYNRPNMVRMIIDKDFYELTQLNEPKSLPITADIIAVSGLNGHAYGSWRSKDGKNMWLRDCLPKDFPSCRTMIFGCNTKLSDDSDFEISDYADTLLLELTKVRRTPEEMARPIIFIGHSFGGVIISQAIVRAHSDKTNGWKEVFDSTRAIAFFGTPHQGLYVDDLKAMVKEGSSRQRLLDALDSGSSKLRDELPKFASCCGNIAIIAFFEVKKTKTVVTTADGVSTATGEPKLRVDRGTAILQPPGTTEHVYLADGDHSRMVKFEHGQERSYRTLIDRLKNLDYSKTPTPPPKPAHPDPPQVPVQAAPRPSSPLTTSPPVTIPSPSRQTPISPPRDTKPLQTPVNPVLDAVLANDPFALRKILQHTPGAVNQRQAGGATTLLHIAIENGYEKVVDVLLECNVNFEAINRGGLSAIQLAAEKGLSRIVRQIMARQGQVHNCEERELALIGAASEGHLETVQVLLDSKVSLDRRLPQKNGMTALLAAAAGGHESVVRLLVRYRAAIEAVEAQRRNALHLAVINNRFGVARLLISWYLDRSICLDTLDVNRYCALHYAASMGYLGVAEALLKQRATVDIRCPEGNTALGLAATNGHKDMVALLLNFGADIDSVNHRRTTPLSLASKGGYVDVVEHLLRRGALVDSFDLFGESAISYATSGGHSRLVDILRTAGRQHVYY